MKRQFILLYGLLLLFVYTAGCGTSSDDTATIQGVVTNNLGSPLADAVVQITAPAELAGNFRRTDSAGVYAFDGIDVSSVTDITLSASLTGFDELLRSITVTPGQSITVDFTLNAEQTGGGDDGDGDGGDGEVPDGEPEIPASIILDGVTTTQINIRGTGGIVNSTLAFVVRDSAGRALDLNSPTEVRFRISRGPGGGEAVTPEVVTTNDQGRAVTSLVAGDSAGVVRLEASLTREDGVTISSSPILISINGGFPDPSKFFVGTANRNVEGFAIIPGPDGDDFRYGIVASVTDFNGNPVKDGTVVDFRTTFGNVGGSAATDEEGLAAVFFRPDGSSPNGPLGLARTLITGRTVDIDDNDVEASLAMLLTTRFANITINPTIIDIPSGSGQTFDVTITDRNGFPMAAGTEVTIVVGDRLAVANSTFQIPDINPLLPDGSLIGPGLTDFVFLVSDGDEDNSDVESTSLTVVVTAPSGAETTLSITGTREKGFEQKITYKE